MQLRRRIRDNPPCVIIRDDRWIEGNYVKDLYLVDSHVFDNLQTSATTIKIQLGHKLRKEIELVGSCNGLLCLSGPPYHNPGCIWNPVTRKKFGLPKPSCPGTARPALSGFGFDTASQKYKDIWGWRTWTGQHHPAQVGTLICTLGGPGKWRKVPDAPHLPSWKLNSSRVFVQGALHWITTKDARKCIASFDMKHEEFRIRVAFRLGRSI